MFETIRDLHALAGHSQCLESVSGQETTQAGHHFQSLAERNSDHAGVVGHGGKDHFPRGFGGNFKKGYLWYDKQYFWDHSYTYDSSAFENPVMFSQVQKSSDPNARYGWLMPKTMKMKAPRPSTVKTIREVSA